MDRRILGKIFAGICGGVEDMAGATVDDEDEDGHNNKGNSLKNISSKENKCRQLHNGNCQSGRG